MADTGRCRLPQLGRTRGCCSDQRTTHHTSTQDGKTAGWLPQLRWIYSPHLRGSRPQSPVAAAWNRTAGQELIASRRQPRSAWRGVVAHPSSCALGRGRPESQNGYPGGHSLPRPPLIRWGQGGDGEGYGHHRPTLDWPLVSEPPVREGRGREGWRAADYCWRGANRSGGRSIVPRSRTSRSHSSGSRSV